MDQMKVKEEQELWELKGEEQSVVQEFKEEPECRVAGVQTSSSIIYCKKEEPEEAKIKPEVLPQFLHVSVKNEEEELLSSNLYQTMTEENREDADAAGEVLKKLPESEQHSDNSSDTDDSEDWAPSVVRPSSQTQSELNEQLHGAAHRNNVGDGAKAKRHTCSECGKSYNKPCELRVHQRSHTGNKPFKCSVCSKDFAEKRVLKIHMIIHTGEKPFKCTVCMMDFTQINNLKRHMKTHTGERPFTCSICDKEFTVMANLNRHMMNHTGIKPYKCSLCAKDFSEQNLLKEHMRSHTGEKPFTCSVCAKGFSVVGNLNKHMITHTGERPFICLLCGRGFTLKSSLKRHEKIHSQN